MNEDRLRQHLDAQDAAIRSEIERGRKRYLELVEEEG